MIGLTNAENSFGFADFGFLVIEVAFWSAVYAFGMLHYLAPWVRASLQKSPQRWKYMSCRNGLLMRSLAEESVVSYVLSFHHLVSGGLMFAGHALNSSQLWVRGIAMELGYETIDTVCILSNSWPYSELSRRRLKVVSLMHHVSTLILIPIALHRGYHNESAVQAIGWSLIGAGGISFFCEASKKMLHLDKELGVWLSIHVLNIAVISFARFLIFPQSCIKVVRTLIKDDVPIYLTITVSAGMLLMFVFNTIVLTTLLLKLFKNGSAYLKHAASQSKDEIAKCGKHQHDGSL